MQHVYALVGTLMLTPALLIGQFRPLIQGKVLSGQDIGVSSITRVAGIAPRADGTIAAVIHPGPIVVIVHNDGSVQTFGKAGSGPGEMRNPVIVGWIGDTLWVGDAALARITLFSERGKLLRSIPVVAPGEPVLLRGGGVALIPFERFTAYEVEQTNIAIARQVNGRVRDTLLRVPMQHRVLRVATQAGLFVGSQPFDDSPLIRSFRDGSGFVVVERSITLTMSSFSVKRFSESGKLSYEKTYSASSVPLTDQEVAAFVDRFIADFPKNADAGLRGRVRKALFRPVFHPPVTKVIPGQDGSVWIQGAPLAGGKTSRWKLLDSNGLTLGDYSLPTSVEPIAGTKMRLWGVQTADDGEIILVEYRGG